MHGGVIDTGAMTLAEQAIYTLIAIGAGAILVAIDMRSPSSVLRYGSMAAGVASVAFIVIRHFVVLNPLLSDESTGQIPVFNLLFLAYLLPAVAAGGLALYARDKRPKWYAQMLAVVGPCLPWPTPRCRSGGCSRASSSACGAGLANSRPTPIRHFGWRSAWRCSPPASG
ncbi:hypothetical protein AJ88_29160 [Mesorhizobium amorphae CCBAU 01583]|nr:hypothetical protein AJ88_29160 [Mesorhizobium amorphae CCBAU 01583]